MIVGLGNPGKEYKNTRHNIGWMVIDEMAKSPEIVSNNDRSTKINLEKKFNAYIGKGKIHGVDVLLVKPNVFMNLSGESVKKIIDYFKIKKDNIWIVSDDLDLPVGKIRIRGGGGSGGHKGLLSIINQIGSESIIRIRLGIAPMIANNKELISRAPETEIYVLEEFNKRELTVVKKTIKRASELIIESIKGHKIDSETISVL